MEYVHVEAHVDKNVRVDIEDVARGVERDELGLRAHGVHCVVLQILYVVGVLSLTAKNEFQFFPGLFKKHSNKKSFFT